MEPIFDKAGKFAGWLVSGTVIDGSGRYRAFISGEAAFDYNAHYLGSFVRGYFLDRDGRAVAFTPGARGKPGRPKPEPAPRMPSVALEPGRPTFVQTPQKVPPPQSVWSQFGWEDFLLARAGEDK